MNSKQRKTLRAIFEKPTLKNIPWDDIEKLFLGLGAKVVNKGGSVVTISMGGKPKTFHRPHPAKEARTHCVNAVRRFLLESGVKL